MSNRLKIPNKVRSAWQLPLTEKIWILILYPYSGFIRAALLILPFNQLSPYLGQHYLNHQLSPLVSKSQRLLAWRVGRITELTARYTPWESKCLVQAIMTKTLLKFYHIPYILHLGTKMTNDTKEPIQAHAWIKVGAWVITGRKGHSAFAIVSSFVSPYILN